MALDKGKPNTDEVLTDNLEIEDTGKDNAIQNLIYYSFYPATCIVPLEDNLIVIEENVPELMKAQNRDPLLQETIKTFHSLLQEKDDEILNLKRNINKDSGGDLAQFQSESIQTELTLEQCNEMERQIIILATVLPERNEKIHQLQQEVTNQQKLLEDLNVEGHQKGNVLKPSASKTEAELDEAYKNLLELEEKNSILQEQIVLINENYKLLEFQLADVNDLKIEIEEAKIQTENNLNDLEKVLEMKDLELKNLTTQLNGGECLASEGCIKPLKNNESLATKMNDFDDVIVELKKKIYEESSVSNLLPVLVEHTTNHEGFQGMSESEIISRIIRICCDEETPEKELIELVPILKCISYQEDGKIDLVNMKSNIPKYKDLFGKLSRKQLVQESVNIGMQLKILENLNKLDLSDLKKEYMKLENILNILNKSFKLTQLGVLNRMSTKDLKEAILEKIETIMEICMHSFWKVILNSDLKENEIKINALFTSADQEMICDNLFHDFQTSDIFLETMVMLKNVRYILLYGELTKEKQKENNQILFMKLYSMNVIHDITNHILPKYPKEIRSKLTEPTVEDSVTELFKFRENISPGFYSSIRDPNRDNNQQELGDLSGVSWNILNILSILNFEDECFLTSTTLQKQELSGHVMSLSNSTRKNEKSQVKVNLQKDIKNKLIEYILKIQFVLNNNGLGALSESCKAKSEFELAKLLVKKKEGLLKLIFKDTFLPAIEKFTIGRGSQFLSCVSKERVNLDFWVKMVLEYYHKEQVKNLQGLTEDEMHTCVKRLLKALELVCPQQIETNPKNKITKSHLVKMIFLYRNILIRKLQDCLVGKRIKFQLYQDYQKSLQDKSVNETPQDNNFEIIKSYFQVPLSNVDQTDLKDVLMRLYDIDKELFPGASDSNRENLKLKKSLHPNDILEEIVYLRLSIISSMVFMIGSSEDMKETVKSDVDRWSVMKKIESTLLNLDLIEINQDLVETEKNFLNKLLKGCNNKKEISEEKLKLAFIEVNQINCRNNGEAFNVANSDKYFDKLPTKEKKVKVICEEVNKILNNFCRNVNYNALGDNYVKLDKVMEDIENDLSKNKNNIKNTWMHTLYEKVTEIRNLISNTIEKEDLSNESMRMNISNYLEEIKQWISDSRKLQENSFSRLNNAIRKLNNLSNKSRRKVKVLNERDLNSENCFNENRAFEKAFSDLEDHINEIGSKKTKPENFRMIVDNEMVNKTDDELRQIMFSLERNLSGNVMGNTESKEMQIEINERAREELEEDCHRLVHSTMVKKLEELFKVESEEIIKRQTVNENQCSKYDENMSIKLSKYQDLCDSLEKCRVPDYDSKGKLSPLTFQYENSSSGTLSHNLKSKNVPGLNNGCEDLDSYFRNRLNELQKYSRNSKIFKDNVPNRSSNNSDVLVDGFEIEDERTPRYYSMRLQDIQHGRKEDELGAIVYKMEQERQKILENNKYLQQQIFVNENLIENQQLKLDALEKSDQILRSRLQAIDSNEKQDNDSKEKGEDINLLKYEIQHLSATILATHQHLDKQNTDLVDIALLNNNLQHDNTQLAIKNKYLLRSFQKLEDLYKEVIHRLENYKLTVEADRKEANFSVRDIELENRLRQSERDKIELVKKLDILDKQNGLLKNHCENLDFQLSKSNKSLAESQSLGDTYLHQVRQLTMVLDSMKSENDSYQSSFLPPKDEDMKRLKNKTNQVDRNNRQ